MVVLSSRRALFFSSNENTREKCVAIFVRRGTSKNDGRVGVASGESARQMRQMTVYSECRGTPPCRITRKKRRRRHKAPSEKGATIKKELQKNEKGIKKPYRNRCVRALGITGHVMRHSAMFFSLLFLIPSRKMGSLLHDHPKLSTLSLCPKMSSARSLVKMKRAAFLFTETILPAQPETWGCHQRSHKFPSAHSLFCLRIRRTCALHSARHKEKKEVTRADKRRRSLHSLAKRKKKWPPMGTSMPARM
nr:hypothetical protein [Pandoravirus massiliensis]